MIDHIGLSVQNYDAAKSFYSELLSTLGYEFVMEVAPPIIPQRACGFGENGKPSFWISEEGKTAPHIHIALTAKSRADVDAFYKKAMEMRAKDNGAPGLRPHYHENYYGTFIIDADGHNIEAVCHKPE